MTIGIIEVVAAVLFHVLAFSATAFPIMYLQTSWVKTSIGRALMWFSTSLALIIDLTVINFWLSAAGLYDEPALWYGILQLLVLLYAVGGTTSMWVEYMRSGRSKKKEHFEPAGDK